MIKLFIKVLLISTFVLGTLCGTLMATYFGEKFGHQRTIMIGAFIFTCGTII